MQTTTMTCDNCHEPGVETTSVISDNGPENWCPFCVTIGAVGCEVCGSLIDEQTATMIAHGDTIAHVCPTELVKYAVKVSAVK